MDELIAVLSSIALWSVAIGAAVAGATLLPFVLLRLAANPVLGGALIGVVFLIESFIGPGEPLIKTPQVYAQDVLFALLLACLPIRLFKREFGFGQAPVLALMLFVVLWMISALLGLSTFQSAGGVQARDDFYTCTAALYLASFALGPIEFGRWGRMGVWMTWSLVVIAMVLAVGYKTGMLRPSEQWLIHSRNEFRVLAATQASILAAAVAVALYAHMYKVGKTSHYVAGVMALLMVVILQHRSVWVATLIMIGIVAARDAVKIVPLLARFAGLALIGVIIVAPISFYLGWTDRLFETLFESFELATRSEGTHTGRIKDWTELLIQWQDYPWWEKLIGRRYGSGWDRWVVDRFISYSPHNAYVAIVLRVGLLGLSAFVFCYVWAVANLWRLARRTTDVAETMVAKTLVAMLIVHMIYFMSYQAMYMHGAVLGAAVAFARMRLASRADQRAAARMSTVPMAG